MKELYLMNKEETEERLNLLIERQALYPMSQAISDEIDRTIEHLHEFDEEEV